MQCNKTCGGQHPKLSEPVTYKLRGNIQACAESNGKTRLYIFPIIPGSISSKRSNATHPTRVDGEIETLGFQMRTNPSQTSVQPAIHHAQVQGEAPLGEEPLRL
jgi:hypothetical protein